MFQNNPDRFSQIESDRFQANSNASPVLKDTCMVVRMIVSKVGRMIRFGYEPFTSRLLPYHSTVFIRMLFTRTVLMAQRHRCSRIITEHHFNLETIDLRSMLIDENEVSIEKVSIESVEKRSTCRLFVCCCRRTMRDVKFS